MKVSSITKNPVARKVTNSIKSPMRKAIAGAMMMTAVLGGTAVANAKTNNNDRIINQTEVVSAEGAKALASMTLQSPTVPTQINNSIKNRIANSAETQTEREEDCKAIDMLFKNYGTYVATIYCQHALNNEYCNTRLLKNTNMTKYYNLFKAESAELHAEFPYIPLAADFSAYKNTIDQVAKHIDEVYEPWFNNYIASIANGNDLSFDKCNKALDEVVKSNSWADIDYYNEQVNVFLFVCKRSNKDVNSIKIKSDLLAYKMFLIDTMYYNNVFENTGLYDLIHGYALDNYVVNGSRIDSAYEDIVGAKINPLVYIYEK